MEQISIGSRLKKAWNVFMNRDPTEYNYRTGMGYSYRPDRPRFSRGNERSIVTAVYNRIAMDVAAVDIKHVRLDENERFTEVIDSNLNYCLSTEANTDQSGRAFIQDIVMSMFDEGCVAIIPSFTDYNIRYHTNFEIYAMRTGKIIEWYPSNVKVRLYDEETGRHHETVLPKRAVGIVENPFYAVMNEPNSTLQRLMRKLALLDTVDENNSSGKLDLIIQLPYVVKTSDKQKQAEIRRKSIEEQLVGSKYGIAYTDATEHITQLNRAVENNLMSQVEYLTNMLFAQLGITQAILDGTADDKVMLNYYSRTIEPILSAITDEMERKFLTKTARTQMQSIKFFRDPFKLIPVSEISEIADKFTRNEIMAPNEIRQIIGMKPSGDPTSDEIRNRNLSQPVEEVEADEKLKEKEEVIQNGKKET